MFDYKAYAGSGNRDTPPEIQKEMTEIAIDLDQKGYTLRTNGGDIPGGAYELSGTTRTEFYLPWKKFNEKTSKYSKPSNEAFDLARKFHNSFDQLNDTVKALVATHCHVILGENLRDPVRMVICWTPDGAESSKECTFRTGISNISIKIASSLQIPVFNLMKPNARIRLDLWLKQNT